MFRTMWSKIKENYKILIALSTTFVTIVYAVIKFIIYVYWDGYFKRLNIDKGFMKLNYEGIIYQALLIFIMLLAVLYVMCMLGTFYEDNWKKYKNKADRKILTFLGMMTMNAFVTLILLSISNLPWLIFICAWGNLSLNLGAIVSVLTLLSVLEIGLILHHLIFEKKPNNKEVSLEGKVATGILMALIIPSAILSIIYSSGSKGIERIQEVRLVENQQYMVTYSDGEKYILHRVEMDENQIVIQRNEQKIIKCDNVECTIKKAKSVHVID